jgi:hypothetical protein
MAAVLSLWRSAARIGVDRDLDLRAVRFSTRAKRSFSSMTLSPDVWGPGVITKRVGNERIASYSSRSSAIVTMQSDQAHSHMNSV